MDGNSAYRIRARVCSNNRSRVRQIDLDERHAGQSFERLLDGLATGFLLHRSSALGKQRATRCSEYIQAFKQHIELDFEHRRRGLRVRLLGPRGRCIG